MTVKHNSVKPFLDFKRCSRSSAKEHWWSTLVDVNIKCCNTYISELLLHIYVLSFVVGLLKIIMVIEIGCKRKRSGLPLVCKD